MIRQRLEQTCLTKCAKAAHESTERNLQALKAQGQAALTQAGRSQGKAVQMVLAELGRQNAYIAETLMRGSGAAEARMKQNLANTATFKQKKNLRAHLLNIHSIDQMREKYCEDNCIRRRTTAGYLMDSNTSERVSA